MDTLLHSQGPYHSTSGSITAAIIAIIVIQLFGTAYGLVGLASSHGLSQPAVIKYSYQELGVSC